MASFIVMGILTVITAIACAFTTSRSLKEAWEAWYRGDDPIDQGRQQEFARHSTRQRWVNYFASTMVEWLCDLQIIIGMAITRAGLSQLDTISSYHLCLIVNYWLLIQNSSWLAESRAFRSFTSGKKETTLELTLLLTRKVATYSSVIVGTVLQVAYFRRITNRWYTMQKGSCYRYL